MGQIIFCNPRLATVKLFASSTKATAFTLLWSLTSLLWTCCSSSIWCYCTDCSAPICFYWYSLLSLNRSFCSAPLQSSLSTLLCIFFTIFLKYIPLQYVLLIFPISSQSILLSGQLYSLCLCFTLLAPIFTSHSDRLSLDHLDKISSAFSSLIPSSFA